MQAKGAETEWINHILKPLAKYSCGHLNTTYQRHKSDRHSRCHAKWGSDATPVATCYSGHEESRSDQVPCSHVLWKAYRARFTGQPCAKRVVASYLAVVRPKAPRSSLCNTTLRHGLFLRLSGGVRVLRQVSQTTIFRSRLGRGGKPSLAVSILLQTGIGEDVMTKAEIRIT